MARIEQAKHIYEVAELFRRRCLIEKKSLLWPQQQAWTSDNLGVLLRVLYGFFGKKVTDDNRSYLERWKEQLADEPLDIHRIAADILAVYWLFPSKKTAKTKLPQIKEVVSWKLDKEQPDYGILQSAYATNIGGTGPWYFTGQRYHIAFYIEFANQVVSGGVDPLDSDACKQVADNVLGNLPAKCWLSRNILLHLLFPDKFERVVSDGEKKRIVDAFINFSGDAKDNDDALYNIRQALVKQYDRPNLDFYNPDIDAQWRGGQKETQRYWIEKTIVEDRPDREDGDYALGRVLWSPQRSKGGADIYRFMRDLKHDDIILHLTDNEAFTGISRVSSEYEEFGGVENTEWGEELSYLVRLKNFTPIDPPLSRDVFFSSPYRERLTNIIRTGVKNLFYNDQPSLNQGAYLTPAPPELVNILNDAYRQLTGKNMIDGAVVLPWVDHPMIDHPVIDVSLQQLVNETNMSWDQIEEIKLCLIEKKQIILEGPPGSGKTYIAEKFGRYFSGNNLDGHHNEQLEIIQFHQSYGYEDFVQGIRPETNEAEGRLEYYVRDGIFKRLCTNADASRDKKFVLIIDEINRGNISRIFGELLLLLEYRDKSVVLPYARSDDPRFFVPPNVYIIGTMNTTDRSLAQIDYALRRRFYFYRLTPVVDGEAPILAQWLAKNGVESEMRRRVLGLFAQLNTRIQTELGEHFQVGHSYFMNPDIGENITLRRVWHHAIMPLLEEYFYNRRDRASILQVFDLDRLLGEGGSEIESD